MIIKISSRKNISFRQLLRYMIEGEERVLDSRIITHNLRSDHLEGWVKEFEVNESYRSRRRKNATILTHEILSWHPKDTPVISLTTLESLTRQYIQSRNPNGLYVGAIHQAKDHFHVHLCVSGVEAKSGKAMRMSKGQLNRLKKTLEAYQREKYPELFYSRVGHGRSKKKRIELTR